MSSRSVAQENDAVEPFCCAGCPIARSPPIWGVYIPGCPVHDIPTATGNHHSHPIISTVLSSPTIIQTPSGTSLVLVGENPVLQTTVLQTPPETVVLLSNLSITPPATPTWSPITWNPISPRSPANTPAAATTLMLTPSPADPLVAPLGGLSLSDNDGAPESRLAALPISDIEAHLMHPAATLPAMEEDAPNNPTFEWSLQYLPTTAERAAFELAEAEEYLVTEEAERQEWNRQGELMLDEQEFLDGWADEYYNNYWAEYDSYIPYAGKYWFDGSWGSLYQLLDEEETETEYMLRMVDEMES